MESHLQKLKFLVTHLGLRGTTKILLRRLFSVDHFYFLTVPLRRVHNCRTRSDITLSRATEEDWEQILSGLGDLDADTRTNLLSRHAFYREGFRHCYIGRTRTGTIVSVQWLIRPDENDVIRSKFRRMFYPLKSEQVLIENIFIFPESRGYGIFTTVNCLLLNLAREEGFQACTAFIRKDNLPSLNEFMKIGFQMQKLITAYNFCGFSWRQLDHRWYKEVFPRKGEIGGEAGRPVSLGQKESRPPGYPAAR